MALINCPECGKQISSSAKQCVHCGCAFTVCPECGNAIVGSSDVCPECGYSLGKTASRQGYGQTQKTDNFFDNKAREQSTVIAENGGQDSITSEDPIGLWQKSSPLDKFMTRSLKWVKILLQIIAVAFLLIGVAVFITWVTKSPLAQLAEAEGIMAATRGLVAFFCIFEIFDALFFRFRETFIRLRCGNWIKKRRYDAITYLKNRCETLDEGAAVSDFGFAVFAEATYHVKEKDYAILYVDLAVRLVFTVGMFIFIGYAIVQNVFAMMAQVLIDAPFEFQFVMLIPAAVFGVILFVSTMVIDSIYGKKFRAWFAENVSDRKIFG